MEFKDKNMEDFVKGSDSKPRFNARPAHRSHASNRIGWGYYRLYLRKPIEVNGHRIKLLQGFCLLTPYWIKITKPSAYNYFWRRFEPLQVKELIIDWSNVEAIFLDYKTKVVARK